MFVKYSDEEFERRFRVTKAVAEEITNRISDSDNVLITRATKIKLTSLEKVLITLRYYATGSFQIVTGDLFSVNQATVSRVVYEISKKIASLAKEDIKIPTIRHKREEISLKFYNDYCIPNIIGVIDGTFCKL